jgi:hypothetical protein
MPHLHVHDVIRACADKLERKGRHTDLEAILAQFPDIEIEDDKAKWNMCERIETAFKTQLGERGGMACQQAK